MELQEENRNSSNAPAISFSRFGRTLEKTQFQRGICTPGSNSNKYLVLPYQKTKSLHHSPRDLAQTQFIQEVLEEDRKKHNVNWLFKRVSRDKPPFFRGSPGKDMPIEPKYNPKFNILYAHVPGCDFKKVKLDKQSLQLNELQEGQLESVEASIVDVKTIRPYSQTFSIRTRPLKQLVPFSKQTSRKPILNKTFCQTNQLFLPSNEDRSKRSHSFHSYAGHEPITRRIAMPDYEVFESWQKTQTKRQMVIDFGKQMNKIISRGAKDNSIDTSLLDYSTQFQPIRPGINFQKQSNRKNEYLTLVQPMQKDQIPMGNMKLLLYTQDRGRIKVMKQF